MSFAVARMPAAPGNRVRAERIAAPARLPEDGRLPRARATGRMKSTLRGLATEAPLLWNTACHSGSVYQSRTSSRDLVWLVLVPLA